MVEKVLVRICIIFVIALAIPPMLFAETVGVFFDSNVAQIKFAAGDVKTALEFKGFTVEMLPIAQLSSSYSNKKVVIAIFSDAAVTGVLTNQGGSTPTGLGEQAYALRTTSHGQLSYWVFGGDNNGVMYGGLQISENIKFNAFNLTYNNQESPAILKRGKKLNLPWDKASGTYGKGNKGTFESTSSQLAIKDVWDMTFWTTWFDEMTRNRYNTVSLWSCNPFSSLVSVPGYEDCSIPNVTYYDGTVKTMTIDEKIAFWKQVMAYAHARGFEFFLFNWNIFTYGATGKHGITDGSAGASDPDTKDYMYKAMKKLLETYPDFDGFGMSIGENNGTEQFVWDTYGKAMYDYAVLNPSRKLRFIHRLHYAGFSEMMSLFAPLKTLSNFTFDVSIKHSQAHMYSTATPNWFSNEYNTVRSNNMKTWLTVRNDDLYYLTWGDPEFARAYINDIIGLGNILQGFYMGCDGYNPTRTFFSKNSVTQGTLEIQRQWYMSMLWGRLSYNPNTSDSVFKSYMGLKYPAVPSDNLFTAGSKASSSIPKITELVQGSWPLDFHWWIEGCSSGSGFRTASDFSGCNVAKGSSLCNIANTASNKCNGKKSSYQLADEIETDATSALSIVDSMSADANTELGVTINNIRAMSCLSMYYAYKIRGATYLKAGQNANKTTALGKAYCWWMKYSGLMDSMYYGMDMQRVNNLPNWHAMDAAVLKDYTDNGGIGIPNCTNTPQAPLAYFTVNPTFITPGETVNFTDQSTNIPTSWSWSFEGGNPSTSTEQNPSVSYAAQGTYSVTLIATNAIGGDTLIRTAYIPVSNTVPVTALTEWLPGTTNNKVSGKNRLMTVMVMGEHTANFSAATVTYGGQTMTKQSEKLYKENTGSSSYASIFTLNEIGVNDASSGTIAVTWSETPSTGHSIYSALLGYVDQNTPVFASATNGLTGTTVTTSALAAASGDMVLMCGATANNNTVTFNNGFISKFESNSTWGDGIGGNKIGNGANETPSFTQSASGRMALCAIVVKNASVSTLNIQNVSDKECSIYPNPASKTLYITFPADNKNREVKIFNAMGQMVYSTQTNNSKLELNVKSLNLKGIVMIQIESNNEISNHKVILQ